MQYLGHFLQMKFILFLCLVFSLPAPATKATTPKKDAPAPRNAPVSAPTASSTPKVSPGPKVNPATAPSPPTATPAGNTLSPTIPAPPSGSSLVASTPEAPVVPAVVPPPTGVPPTSTEGKRRVKQSADYLAQDPKGKKVAGEFVASETQNLMSVQMQKAFDNLRNDPTGTQQFLAATSISQLDLNNPNLRALAALPETEAIFAARRRGAAQVHDTYVASPRAPVVTEAGVGLAKATINEGTPAPAAVQGAQAEVSKATRDSFSALIKPGIQAGFENVIGPTIRVH